MFNVLFQRCFHCLHWRLTVRWQFTLQLRNRKNCLHFSQCLIFWKNERNVLARPFAVLHSLDLVCRPFRNNIQYVIQWRTKSSDPWCHFSLKQSETWLDLSMPDKCGLIVSLSTVNRRPCVYVNCSPCKKTSSYHLCRWPSVVPRWSE